MAKPGRPPKPVPSVAVGRMDRALRELVARPVETMPDRDYVTARASLWDELFAQGRAVDEIVDFLLEQVPDLGRARSVTMVNMALKRFRAKAEAATVTPASSTPPDDDGYDSFGIEEARMGQPGGV